MLIVYYSCDTRVNWSEIHGRVGYLPDKLLLEKPKAVKEDMLKMEGGIFPVREASLMFNISSRERFPISGGTPPKIVLINYTCSYIQKLRMFNTWW